MQAVIRADGTTYNPPEPTGPGRKPKYPWRYLAIGDHFEASVLDAASIRVLVSIARMFGRDHTISRGCCLKVTRET
jgi:hypothetical protein